MFLAIAMKFKALLLTIAVVAFGTPALATVYGLYGAAPNASASLIQAQGDTVSVLDSAGLPSRQHHPGAGAGGRDAAWHGAAGLWPAARM